MSALLRHALSNLRGQILWYGVGLACWAGIDCLMFNLLQDSLRNLEYPEGLLNAFGAQGAGMDSPRGYFSTEFFSMSPLVAGAFVLFASTGALAGEEGSGTMEMLAALPLSRPAMFAAKAIAIVIALLAILALTIVGWTGAIPFVDLEGDMGLAHLAGATVAQLPFLLFMLATGLLFGAIAPTRSAAAAWTAIVLIVSYLLVAIGSITDSAAALKYVSPYYYADLSGILVNGVKAWHLLLLLGLTAAIGGVAERAFEGRELGSERWQVAAMLGPRTVATNAAGTRPSGARAPAPPRARWAWLAAGLVLLVAAGGGGYAGYRYLATRPQIVTVDGRVDARSATVFAPTSGIVRVLTVAKGEDLPEGTTIGWMEGADGATVPIVVTMRGRVTSIAIEPGQYLIAGTPMLVVYDLQSLHLTLVLDEDDVHRVRPGDPVAARFTTIGIEAATSIASIASVPQPVDPARTTQTRKYEAESFLVNSDARILVGMPVKAQITVTRDAGAPLP